MYVNVCLCACVCMSRGVFLLFCVWAPAWFDEMLNGVDISYSLNAAVSKTRRNKQGQLHGPGNCNFAEACAVRRAGDGTV